MTLYRQWFDPLSVNCEFFFFRPLALTCQVSHGLTRELCHSVMFGHVLRPLDYWKVRRTCVGRRWDTLLKLNNAVKRCVLLNVSELHRTTENVPFD